MKGLYQKYTVTKNDGPTDPHAEYFVLRLDGEDRAARVVARLYAELIRHENRELADGLFLTLNLIADARI